MKTHFTVEKKTIGITDIEFEVKYVINEKLTHIQEFRLVDVGGQRNERKKWVNAFKDIQVVLYVFSLNDYDLLCYEDDKTNRLKESLEEFEKIINSEWFQSSLVILIMNKSDLFKEKIKKVPLKSYFENFNGGDDLKKKY